MFRRKNEFSALACLVCRHVAADIRSAGFIVHDSGGWAAFCREDCPDTESGDHLAMVHQGHLASIKGLPGYALQLPINYLVRLSAEGWRLEIFDDPYTPELGDFHAPPMGSPYLSLRDDDVVHAFRLKRGKLVTVTMEESGLQAVPFWTAPGLEAAFREKLYGFEEFAQLPLSEIRTFARKKAIAFMAPDFLLQEHDVALAV